MSIALLLQSLTILVSPLYIIRFKIPLLHYTIPTTLLEIILLISVFVTLIDFSKANFPWKKLKTPLDLYIVIFLIAAIVATATSHDISGGIGILKAYFFEPVLFFYCLVYQIRKSGFKYIIWSLIATAVWLSLFGFLQRFFPALSLAPNEIAQGRVTAVYNSANSLALFLSPVIILTIYKIITVKNKSTKIILLLLCLFFILVLILTRSKGGIVGLSVSLGIFYFALLALKDKFIRSIWPVVPILIFSALCLFFTNVYFMYHNTNLVNSALSGDSLKVRYVLWRGTVSLLKSSPIFGAGLNGFRTTYLQFKDSTAEILQYPHNIILTFWAEMGLLGLISFTALLVANFKIVYTTLYRKTFEIKKNPSVYLGLALIAILTYWVIHGMVDVPYFKNDLSLQFWLVLSLIVTWSEKFSHEV